MRRCDIADDGCFPQFLARQKKIDIAPPPPCPCWENRYVHPSGLTGSVRLHLPFLQIPPLTQTFQNQNTSEVLPFRTPSHMNILTQSNA